MIALLYLIPASLFLGLLALMGFIWTVQTDQYDDLEGEKHRIIGDDSVKIAKPEGLKHTLE